MKKLSLLLVLFAALSCTKKEGVETLNGYWEIQKVKMPDGKEKSYPASPMIDYFELKGNKGFRKKVMPQVDGTYMASDSSEEVELVTKDGKTWIKYTTQFSNWQEELVSVNEDELVIKNAYNMECLYVRPENFTLKEDGKKAE